MEVCPCNQLLEKYATEKDINYTYCYASCLKLHELNILIIILTSANPNYESIESENDYPIDSMSQT